MTRAFVGAVDLASGVPTASGVSVRAHGFWIAGEARIDGRRDLLAALGRSGEDVHRAADLTLVADAYRAWGDRCVEHLVGDFSFAIWDEPHQRLFAARDQLGIKPFYYARRDTTIVFGSTLAGVRRHPAVSARLDEIAIGDFLLFDVSPDLTRTMYVDIQRLAPAHRLTAGRLEGFHISRYWSMPIDEPARFARENECIDRFRDLLGQAVAERLDPAGVGIFMSGGTDSTSLAATAVSLGADVRAFVWAEDNADGGAERRGAEAAAAHLAIAMDVHVPDAAPVDWTWERKHLGEVEPTEGAWRLDAIRAYYRRIASTRSVFFHGEGPDNALYYEWRPYLAHLLRTRRVGALASDIRRYMATRRGVPLSDGLRAVARRGRDAHPPQYPSWLRSGFEQRASLRDRWHTSRTEIPARHPSRPDAYASLHSPLWQALFTAYDPERTGAAFEVRHPFLDLRVLRFMLSVPVIPWCRDKYLLRRAMHGALPAAVAQRRKRGLPATARERTERWLALQPTAPARALKEYVNVEAVAAAPLATRHDVSRVLRMKSLNRWLKDIEEMRV